MPCSTVNLALSAQELLEVGYPSFETLENQHSYSVVTASELLEVGLCLAAQAGIGVNQTCEHDDATPNLTSFVEAMFTAGSLLGPKIV